MADDRLRAPVEFSNRMREQKCTTPGHEDRKGEWLIEREDQDDVLERFRSQRWACTECAGRS